MSDNAGRTAAVIGMGLAGFGLGSLIAPMFGGWLGTMIPGLGYMGGSFLGSMLFGPDPENSMPPMSHYPVQTASKGPPIPVMYGTARMAGNVIWMGPLHTYKIEQDGGKGGPEAPSQTGYYRSFCIALCEGKRNVLRVWQGKDEIAIGGTLSQQCVAIIVGQGGITQELTIFPGDGVNYGLSDLIGEEFADYRHTLCAFFDSWDLGMTDMIPNFTFEVSQDVPLGLIVGGNGTAFRLNTDYQIVQDLIPNKLFTHSVDSNPRTGRWLVSGGPLPLQSGAIAHIYEADGTAVDITFEEPAGGWDATVMNMGTRFSQDGQYIFVYTVDPCALYKFRLADGSLEWEVDLDHSPYYYSQNAFTFAIDALDYCYVVGVRTGASSPFTLGLFDSDGNLVRQYTGLVGLQRQAALCQQGLYIDESSGEQRIAGKIMIVGLSIEY